MASVGQELKRERELRGISLKEIADTTKIGLRFLRALEEDRLDLLPEKFFTRGIIRSYAKYLGLDEENIMNTYLENLQTAEEEEAKEFETEESPKPLPRKIKSWLVVTLTFIAVLALVIVLYFVFQEKEIPSDAHIPPPLPPAEEKPIVSPPPVKTEPEEQEEKTPEGIDLNISFQQETWIEIHADGELLYAGIKPPGTQFQFNAVNEFLIHIGNAGGITYRLNGKQGKNLGPSGAVVKNIQITLENIEEYVIEDEKTQIRNGNKPL
jgi:transcriptional regulator with XRE-family HTH domain